MNTALPPLREDLEKMQKQYGPLPKLVETMMWNQYPELMRALYPRVYENIGAYHSPQRIAAYLATVITEAQRYGLERIPASYRVTLPALGPLIQKRVPTFFISPALLEAVKRTDFNDDIDWVDMKLPFESGILILPKGGVVHPVDGDVSRILWHRHPKDIDIRIPSANGLAPLQTLRMQNGAFTLTSLCLDHAVWFDSTLSEEKRRTFRFRNLFYRGRDERVIEHEHRTVYERKMEPADEDYIEQIGVIAFGTLLAMNARPELLEPGRMLRRVTKANNEPKEFWSPNVIGAKYKPKREIPRLVGAQFVYTSEGQEHGTHASPRLHWRRGHFRNQAFGPARRERKIIWLEPCLIGAALES